MLGGEESEAGEWVLVPFPAFLHWGGGGGSSHPGLQCRSATCPWLWLMIYPICGEMNATLQKPVCTAHLASKLQCWHV